MLSLIPVHATYPHAKETILCDDGKTSELYSVGRHSLSTCLHSTIQKLLFQGVEKMQLFFIDVNTKIATEECVLFRHSNNNVFYVLL